VYLDDDKEGKINEKDEKIFETRLVEFENKVNNYVNIDDAYKNKIVDLIRHSLKYPAYFSRLETVLFKVMLASINEISELVPMDSQDFNGTWVRKKLHAASLVAIAIAAFEIMNSHRTNEIFNYVMDQFDSFGPIHKAVIYVHIIREGEMVLKYLLSSNYESRFIRIFTERYKLNSFPGTITAHDFHNLLEQMKDLDQALHVMMAFGIQFTISNFSDTYIKESIFLLEHLKKTLIRQDFSIQEKIDLARYIFAQCSSFKVQLNYREPLKNVKDAIEKTSDTKIEAIAIARETLSTNPKAVAQILSAMVKGNGKNVREAVKDELRRLYEETPQKQAVLDGLINQLENKNLKVRYLALDMIKELSPHDLPIDYKERMDVHSEHLKEEWITTDPQFASQYLSHKLLVHSILNQNIFHNLEAFLEKKKICVSLIDLDHAYTYGSAGFIFDVPIENIRSATPIDAQSHIFYVTKSDAIPSAKKLLENSGGWYIGYHNEVIIFGHNPYTDQKIEIIGIYINKSMVNYPEGINEMVIEYAQKHALPVVYIQNEFKGLINR
jgi:hypothetical protein